MQRQETSQLNYLKCDTRIDMSNTVSEIHLTVNMPFHPDVNRRSLTRTKKPTKSLERCCTQMFAWTFVITFATVAARHPTNKMWRLSSYTILRCVFALFSSNLYLSSCLFLAAYDKLGRFQGVGLSHHGRHYTVLLRVK